MAQIEGRNPVLEALKAGREVERLYVAKGAREGAIREILRLARQRGVIVEEVERVRLDQWSQGRNHQGVLARVAALSYANVDEILARAEASGEPPLILICDGIEDPHNLGSLLRTADGAGVHGVIIPERRAVGLTETVVKVAAGAAEHVPVARVTNLVRTAEALKAAGLWLVGTHQDAEQPYFEADLRGPLGVVVGSEGRGISRLLLEKCDFTVSLPMRGQVTSLNAGVAGGILLYEVLRQRQRG